MGDSVSYPPLIVVICQHFILYMQRSCSVDLSMKKKLITLSPGYYEYLIVDRNIFGWSVKQRLWYNSKVR